MKYQMSNDEKRIAMRAIKNRTILGDSNEAALLHAYSHSAMSGVLEMAEYSRQVHDTSTFKNDKNKVQKNAPDFVFSNVLRSAAETGFIPYAKYLLPFVSGKSMRNISASISNLRKEGYTTIKNEFGWVIEKPITAPPAPVAPAPIVPVPLPYIVPPPHETPEDKMVNAFREFLRSMTNGNNNPDMTDLTNEELERIANGETK